MSSERSVIKIIVEYGNEQHTLETYSHGYRSLMHFIFDKIYIEDFGDCRGMGRCGTCLVEILNQQYSSADFERNELTTIGRLGELIPNTRLACQILVDERINNLHCRVILPESLGF
jgi:2Fe-2S ferredoxin